MAQPIKTEIIVYGPYVALNELYNAFAVISWRGHDALYDQSMSIASDIYRLISIDHIRQTNTSKMTMEMDKPVWQTIKNRLNAFIVLDGHRHEEIDDVKQRMSDVDIQFALYN